MQFLGGAAPLREVEGVEQRTAELARETDQSPQPSGPAAGRQQREPAGSRISIETNSKL